MFFLTANQYEKWECSFFNLEPEENAFHLRQPVLDLTPEGVLGEPEIHARLVEALGAMPTEIVDTLSETLRSQGPAAFGLQIQGVLKENPKLMPMMPAILYRTLGPYTAQAVPQRQRPCGSAAHMFAQRHPGVHEPCGIRRQRPHSWRTAVPRHPQQPVGRGVSPSMIRTSSWDRLRTPEKEDQCQRFHRCWKKWPAWRNAPGGTTEDYPIHPLGWRAAGVYRQHHLS